MNNNKIWCLSHSICCMKHSSDDWYIPCRIEAIYVQNLRFHIRVLQPNKNLHFSKGIMVTLKTVPWTSICSYQIHCDIIFFSHFFCKWVQDQNTKYVLRNNSVLVLDCMRVLHRWISQWVAQTEEEEYKNIAWRKICTSLKSVFTFVLFLKILSHSVCNPIVWIKYIKIYEDVTYHIIIQHTRRS